MKNSSSILLVYEEIPENLKIFLIPSSVLSIEDRRNLVECHGKYIDQDEWLQSDWLCKFMEGIEDRPSHLLYDDTMIQPINLFDFTTDPNICIIVTGQSL